MNQACTPLQSTGRPPQPPTTSFCAQHAPKSARPAHSRSNGSLWSSCHCTTGTIHCTHAPRRSKRHQLGRGTHSSSGYWHGLTSSCCESASRRQHVRRSRGSSSPRGRQNIEVDDHDERSRPITAAASAERPSGSRRPLFRCLVTSCARLAAGMVLRGHERLSGPEGVGADGNHPSAAAERGLGGPRDNVGRALVGRHFCAMQARSPGGQPRVTTPGTVGQA